MDNNYYNNFDNDQNNDQNNNQNSNLNCNQQNGAVGNYSNPYQQPTYQSAGYQNTNYQNTNYQNMNSQNVNAQTVNGQSAGGQGGYKPPKKKNNFGVTLAKCAAIALVFGLVAGTVFTGVNYVGNKVLGVSSSKVEESTQNSESKKESEKEDSQLQQQGDVEQTSTGYAKELTDVADIVDEVMPSIVAITNTSTVTYQQFWGPSQSYESSSCGSGIIISQDDKYLYIVTNNHVVDGADKLTVQFCDDATVSCEVKGTDAADDLAVVKVALDSIEAETLSKIKVATVGDSEQVQVGEAAIAIGNALGYGQSVTTGVISALGRTVTVSDESNGLTVTNNNLIQTDAAINPGNSGGALLNAKGEVIGINSAKYSDTAVEGIGYAIPMADALPIIQQLITREKVEEAKSAYLGIQGQDVSSDVAQAYGMPEGVYVYSVISNSAADQAGIRQGDIITKFDGQQITSMSALKELLSYYAEGQQVTITIQRMNDGGYQQTDIQVTLGGQNSVQN